MFTLGATECMSQQSPRRKIESRAQINSSAIRFLSICDENVHPTENKHVILRQIAPTEECIKSQDHLALIKDRF